MTTRPQFQQPGQAARELREAARRIMQRTGKTYQLVHIRKVKTAATMVCVVVMFLPIPPVLNTVCVWVITLTTLYSGVEYFVKNKDVIQSI